MTLCTFHSLCMLNEAVHNVWWDRRESPSAEILFTLDHFGIKAWLGWLSITAAFIKSKHFNLDLMKAA